ncbi:kinase domain-containing protein [Xylariaceae sp. FL0804]|nr:kinase domain-containing protein [Xylariaceae sp. FL0804]
MWWDDARIEATVTRQFVCSHLAPDEARRLDLCLGFGDGLTDGTYWEWIEEKAKRVFLILVDLGIASQIFGVIDTGCDDHDLPIAIDQVEHLALRHARDHKLVKKFYYRQYHYLLKFIEEGDHVVYQEDDVVPICTVDKGGPGRASSHSIDRVELPNRPGAVFTRRRFPLGHGPGLLPYESLLYEIDSIRHVQNEHLMSYAGSYFQAGYGYVLFTNTCDASVKSLLTTTPGSVKSLAKRDRRRLVMNWIHCLADTLCYLHGRGRSHGNIKPSTIHFDSGNHVFLAGVSRLSAEPTSSNSSSSSSSSSSASSDKGTFDKEAYDYAAPEQWYRPSPGLLHHSSGSHRKQLALTSPTSPHHHHNKHDHLTFPISRGNGGGPEPSSPASALRAPNPALDPQAADVYSLGCVALELLGGPLLLKRPARAFAAHRAARHRAGGRGGAVLDSSFHQNPGQVETWMAGLARDAGAKLGKEKDHRDKKKGKDRDWDKDKKKGKDRDGGGGNGGNGEEGEGEGREIFAGVAPVLGVVARMLAAAPSERPSAREVEQALYNILTEHCGLPEPHCVHQYYYGEEEDTVSSVPVSVAVRGQLQQHRRDQEELELLDEVYDEEEEEEEAAHYLGHRLAGGLRISSPPTAAGGASSSRRRSSATAATTTAASASSSSTSPPLSSDSSWWGVGTRSSGGGGTRHSRDSLGLGSGLRAIQNLQVNAAGRRQGQQQQQQQRRQGQQRPDWRQQQQQQQPAAAYAGSTQTAPSY